jgi:hypothetical protein
MKAAITLVLAQLGLVALAIAAGPALADPYRLHHDYYKLTAAKGAGAQSQTGVPVRVNPALTWLHRGLTPPQVGAARPQSQTGASHAFPWSSIGVGVGVAVAVVAGLLLVAMLKVTRRGHTTAV